VPFLFVGFSYRLRLYISIDNYPRRVVIPPASIDSDARAGPVDLLGSNRPNLPASATKASMALPVSRHLGAILCRGRLLTTNSRLGIPEL